MLIESLPDGTQRLTLPKTSPADEGNYECVATNPAGTARSKAPLSVIRECALFAKTNCQLLKILRNIPAEEKEQPPTFRKGLEDQSLPKVGAKEEFCKKNFNFCQLFFFFENFRAPNWSWTLKWMDNRRA